jgi:hypothetical protein
MLTTPTRKRGERGQVMVLFALLVPVILTIGSIVVSGGNWYVLKRHLQTQVDAGALAAGPAFTGCLVEPGAANMQIRQAALQYSGDRIRDPVSFNPQLQQTGDQRVVINSTNYWSPGPPRDPTDGTGLDFTLGQPCDVRFVDVKATDEDAPLLFRWIPLFPDLKARARVEILEVEGARGVLPIGVPEVDPRFVGVLFVNEDAVNPNSAIVGRSLLDDVDEATLPPGDPLQSMGVWRKDNITPVNLNGNESFSVIVVASRNASFSIAGSNLASICGQADTRCYGGSGQSDGISFIHSYTGAGAGTATVPIVRDVTLSGGCPEDYSAPYFNEVGGCPLGITATIDFGTGAIDPTRPVAAGGVCAEVSSSPGGALTYSGGAWSGFFTPSIESGQNPVDLSWSTDTNGGCNGPNNGSGSFPEVAKPFVGDESPLNSGPVKYLTVEFTSGGLANSVGGGAANNLEVTVGLFPPLRDTPILTAPPIPLRFGFGPSQTQALDCGSGSGPNGWRGKMVEGCDPYQINQRNGSCATPYPVPPDCIDSQNGNYNNKGVEDAFASPCTPNNWDGATLPPPDDPRWISLFIVDEVAFTSPGKKTYPIRRFGGFYVTAGDGMGCPGDVPSTVRRTELWGHFVTYVTPRFDAIPRDELCQFGFGSLCAPVLVE